MDSRTGRTQALAPRSAPQAYGKGIAVKRFALVALLTVTPPVTAQVTGPTVPDWPIFSAERAGSIRYKQCLGDMPSTVQETHCLADEYAVQKAKLAFAYRAKLSGGSLAERAQRVAAQQAWAQFRDANCKVRALNSGSGAETFYWGCMVRETITRRAELVNNWDY